MRCAILAILLAAGPLAAQQDTLRLGPLQGAAVERDPRVRQLVLQEQATALRLRNLAAERLPAFAAGGQLSHQSEVPAIPIDQPGFEVPEPPKDRYEARVDVEQRVYDGGENSSRRAAERARLEAERAAVSAELHPLRAEVNQAFFRALLLQERIAEITALIEDLEARLDVIRARVVEGAALPGDTAVVRAEMLRAVQTRNEAGADRRAALAVLARLTGVAISEAEVLEVPDLAAEVAEARAAAAPGAAGQGVPGNPTLRSHPRYAVFDARRQELDRRTDVLESATRPRVSAFGQWGYGRPGYEMFTTSLHDYWMAGVRVDWRPWTWGTAGREEELLRVERAIVDTEEAAFTDALDRQVQDALASMDHLVAALEIDREIVVLRQQVESQASAQLAESAITPAEYVDARTDLEEARLTLRRHEVELAEARARYLTSLGVTLP